MIDDKNTKQTRGITRLCEIVHYLYQVAPTEKDQQLQTGLAGLQRPSMRWGEVVSVHWWRALQRHIHCGDTAACKSGLGISLAADP